MGVFPSDARAIHAALAAKDKRLELIAGAHYFEDREDNRERAVEVMVEWIRARC
jgi:hypothetical protein